MLSPDFGPRRASFADLTLNKRNKTLIVPFRSSIEVAITSSIGMINEASAVGTDYETQYHLSDAERTRTWLQSLSKTVALRDYLDASFALDFTREQGFGSGNLT